MRSGILKAACLGLAVSGLPVATALAQTAGAPPIVRGVTSNDLSFQLAETRQQLAEQGVRLNAAQDDIRRLTGELETTRFELSRSQTQNQQLLADVERLGAEMDRARRQMEAQSRAISSILLELGLEPEPDLFAGAPAEPAQAGLPPEPAQNGPGTAGGPRILAQPGGGLPEGSLGTLPASQLPGESGPLFAEARSRLLRLDYAGAEQAFRHFIDVFEKDPQAGEAHFWLAEALYQQQAYSEAGGVYTTMIRSFPDDARAPDALVRLARTMRLIGERDRACQALETLPRRYPNASRTVRDLAAVERTQSRCAN
jgi:tol-pal system protein YbgF